MSQKEVKQVIEFDENKFRERFIKLREKHKMTQAEFAAYLEIPTGSVGGYESGKKFPNGKTLFKIACKCEISADYLLGLQKEPTIKEDMKMICNYIGLSGKTVKLLNEFVSARESDFLQILDNLIHPEFPTPFDVSLLSLTGGIIGYEEEYSRVINYLKNAYESKDTLSEEELSEIGKQSEKDLQYAKTFLYDAVFGFKNLIDSYIEHNVHSPNDEELFENFWNEIFSR